MRIGAPLETAIKYIESEGQSAPSVLEMLSTAQYTTYAQGDGLDIAEHSSVADKAMFYHFILLSEGVL